MSNVERIPVSVIVARERVDHPWQDHVWRAVEVSAAPLPLPDWAVLRRSDEAVVYHAGAALLELHRKDTPAYVENLTGERPALYVVLRADGAADNAMPVEVVIVSASAFDAQSNAESGSEIVGRVPIPPPLLDRIEAFLAENHQEERFTKRQRAAHPRGESHLFGQEPIDDLRKRMRSNSDNGGS